MPTTLKRACTDVATRFSAYNKRRMNRNTVDRFSLTHEATSLPGQVAAVTRLPFLPQRPICQHLDVDAAHCGAGLKPRLAAVVRPVPVGQGHAAGAIHGRNGTAGR